MAAVGYVYALSKRTELYGTYAAIHNKGAAVYATADAVPGEPGRNASGLQLGITHRF